MSNAATAVHTADWRRKVFALYGSVRQISATNPEKAHAHWISSRDDLFAGHPATPLLEAERSEFRGLPYSRYDPDWRFELELVPTPDVRRLDVETGTDGVVPFDLLGTVAVPYSGTLEVWRLAAYGGGLFIPVKDTLAGKSGGTYGGGRYLIDTIKGADLGAHTDGEDVSIVLDFNFAYNPSCAYDPEWACPLAQAGNTLSVEVPVGERYHG